MDLEAATTCLGVNWATSTNTSPQPGKQATSPGISGKTPPPPPVAPVSPGQAMSPAELEAAARRAVSEFVEAKYGAHRGTDVKKVEMLNATAVCLADENWLVQNQLNLNNHEKLSDADRLLRQALETKQGLAEIFEDIAAKKFAELFVAEQELKHRLDDPRGKPLTDQEKRNIVRSKKRLGRPHPKITANGWTPTLARPPSPIAMPNYVRLGLPVPHTQ